MINNLSNDDLNRIRDKAHKATRYPLTTLVTQCYSFIVNTSGYPEGVKTHFQKIFNNFVFRPFEENIALPLYVYDDETESYYVVKTIGLDVKSVNMTESDTNTLGFPSVTVESSITQGVEYGGTADDLYDKCKDWLIPQIEDGWFDLSLHKNDLYRPLNHLTPYDLCSLTNITYLLSVLAWFMQSSTAFTSVGKVMHLMDHQLYVDKYMLMSMELFLSFSSNLFVNSIKQPDDPELLKDYSVRCYADFHNAKIPKNKTASVRKRLKENGIEMDVKDLRILPINDMPLIEFYQITSVEITAI